MPTVELLARLSRSRAVSILEHPIRRPSMLVIAERGCLCLIKIGAAAAPDMHAQRKP